MAKKKTKKKEFTQQELSIAAEEINKITKAKPPINTTGSISEITQEIAEVKRDIPLDEDTWTNETDAVINAIKAAPDEGNGDDPPEEIQEPEEKTPPKSEKKKDKNRKKEPEKKDKPKPKQDVSDLPGGFEKFENIRSRKSSNMISFNSTGIIRIPAACVKEHVPDKHDCAELYVNKKTQELAIKTMQKSSEDTTTFTFRKPNSSARQIDAKKLMEELKCLPKKTIQQEYNWDADSGMIIVKFPKT